MALRIDQVALADAINSSGVPINDARRIAHALAERGAHVFEDEPRGPCSLSGTELFDKLDQIQQDMDQMLGRNSDELLGIRKDLAALMAENRQLAAARRAILIIGIMIVGLLLSSDKDPVKSSSEDHQIQSLAKTGP